jgi:bifunctional ADP-heptose synthase (sugar kinase/adenylyltransferase)
MISTSFGLLFYFKKRLSDPRIELPVYIRITVSKISKEISVQRSWPPSCWNAEMGRAIVRKKAMSINVKPKSRDNDEEEMAISMDDQARAVNAYLDTLQAKVFEAKHRLIESGKPVTAEAIKNLVQGKDDKGCRPHLLLEIFQYHNDQVKALIGSEYSKGTLTKFVTVFKHTRAFLQWKYKADDIDIRKLD